METARKISKTDIIDILAVWGAESLAQSLDIAFSPRLSRSLGRTRVDKRVIRLNPILQSSDPEVFREVLCHELAHVVVYERFGAGVRPHGKEWRELVSQTGVAPRVRIPRLGVGKKSVERRVRYEHRCPVCQVVRFSSRPISRWRCAACVSHGLEGRLTISGVSR